MCNVIFIFTRVSQVGILLTLDWFVQLCRAPACFLQLRNSWSKSWSVVRRNQMVQRWKNLGIGLPGLRWRKPTTKRTRRVLKSTPTALTPKMRKIQKSLLRTLAKLGLGPNPDGSYSAQALVEVAQTLRKLGYRSVKNYLGAMKRSHIESGATWTSLHLARG